MKKLLYKTITVLCAAVTAFNTAALGADTDTALYYDVRELTTFNGNDIIYVPFDNTSLDRIIGEVRDLLKTAGNEAEIIILLNEGYEEYQKASYSATIAQLSSDRAYSDESSKTAQTALTTAIDAAEQLSNLTKEVYESGYGTVLENVLNSSAEEVAEYIDSIPSARFYDLCREENEYKSQYSSVYTDSAASAELFIRLAKIRREIAEEAGYDSYPEYAHTDVYCRDYTEAEIEEFSNAAAEQLTPLWSALAPITYYYLEDRYSDKTDDEIIELVGNTLRSVNSELGDSFGYMIDNDLFDIECRSGKDPSAGAYTVVLDGINVPYLFISNEEDSAWRVKTFIHESGHFCSLLNTSALDEDWIDFLYSMSIDTCEVHSQGLELLATYDYGRIFGRDAAYERYSELLTLIDSVLEGCYMNEWQTIVYNEPELTVEKANSAAKELSAKYFGIDMTDDEAQDYWTSIPHNFTSPMYYISYGVSAAAALGLYALSVNDYASAVDKYMKISAMGGFTEFKEALDNAELYDIFDSATMELLSFEIGKSLGLEYIDIDYNDWYAPYFFETSHISDGRSEFLFRPDENITRREFIKLIGKMYDYYEGIDGDYTMTFTDVSTEDDSAKYISWACENGITTGYSRDTFGPEDEITREQVVTILHRLYSLEHESTPQKTNLLYTFPDSSTVSVWARDAMAFMVDHSIINGRGDGYIVPQDSATRAEAAKIAACYIDKVY